MLGLRPQLSTILRTSKSTSEETVGIMILFLLMWMTGLYMKFTCHHSLLPSGLVSPQSCVLTILYALQNPIEQVSMLT